MCGGEQGVGVFVVWVLGCVIVCFRFLRFGVHLWDANCLSQGWPCPGMLLALWLLSVWRSYGVVSAPRGCTSLLVVVFPIREPCLYHLTAISEPLGVVDYTPRLGCCVLGRCTVLLAFTEVVKVAAGVHHHIATSSYCNIMVLQTKH